MNLDKPVCKWTREKHECVRYAGKQREDGWKWGFFWGALFTLCFISMLYIWLVVMK